MEGVRIWYIVFIDCNMGINVVLCSFFDLKVLEILITILYKIISYKKKRLSVLCVFFFYININIFDLMIWLSVGLMRIIMIVFEYIVLLMWFNKMES